MWLQVRWQVRDRRQTWNENSVLHCEIAVTLLKTRYVYAITSSIVDMNIVLVYYIKKKCFKYCNMYK